MKTYQPTRIRRVRDAAQDTLGQPAFVAAYTSSTAMMDCGEQAYPRRVEILRPVFAMDDLTTDAQDLNQLLDDCAGFAIGSLEVEVLQVPGDGLPAMTGPVA